MELRVLRYFLTVAREQNITRAAELLHISQPTLSRQLMQLEEELGTTLYKRGNRNITLTEAGMLLRRRAEEVVEMVTVIEGEFSEKNLEISGQVAIGSGDMLAVETLVERIAEFQQLYPNVTYQLFTGNADQIKERIDMGLCDIGVVIEPVDISKYECLPFEKEERWGLLVPKEDPLSKEPYITPEMLVDLPIFISHRSMVQERFESYTGVDFSKLHIVGTIDLLNLVLVFIRKGLGYTITVEGNSLIRFNQDICFIPFQPKLTTKSVLIWKKHQTFSPTVTKFISFLEMSKMND